MWPVLFFLKDIYLYIYISVCVWVCVCLNLDTLFYKWKLKQEYDAVIKLLTDCNFIDEINWLSMNDCTIQLGFFELTFLFSHLFEQLEKDTLV